MQGVLLPEDIERQEAMKKSSEHLLELLKRKREARAGKQPEEIREAMAMMERKDIKREQTEEHKQLLRETIAKFNKNCYSEKGNRQTMLRNLVKE